MLCAAKLLGCHIVHVKQSNWDSEMQQTNMCRCAAAIKHALLLMLILQVVEVLLLLPCCHSSTQTRHAPHGLR
jgi:hypothetical protein